MTFENHGHKITDKTNSTHSNCGDAVPREIVAQMDAYKKEKMSTGGSDKSPASQAANTDILPSGKRVERAEDGFPIGGRVRQDNNWQAYKDHDAWSDLQHRRDLSPQEKYAAGTMGLQLGRRVSDPLRDEKLMHDNWTDRVDAAKKTFDAWSNAAKVLDGKLNPEQEKIAKKVSDELKVELLQEEWRRKKFGPR